jgi:hypothetical protein
MEPAEALDRGREAYSRRAWMGAYEALAAADRAVVLGADDLERLATSAYMLGRDDDYPAGLQRAYQLHLEADEPLRAVRCAFWVGLDLALRGETGGAGGWLARAQRLLERTEGDSVEGGYLLIPLMFRHEADGDFEGAAAVAATAARVGERFGDRDLFALAVHSQGTYLVKQGRVGEGLELMDEAMIAVTAQELSPIASGLVYCGVIVGCQEAYELRRAREWTAALSRWCEQQPDMVAFTGRCLTHRAEIMCPRRLGRGARRGAPGGSTLRAGTQRACARRGRVRAGRTSSPAGRARCGRAGLPRDRRRPCRAGRPEARRAGLAAARRAV